MEHEDQNIRNKVREWECRDRAINRDQLWATLAVYPIQRPARPSAFYLAAAVLALSGALIVYTLGETQRRAVELRMMEIELSLKQAEVIPQQVALVPPQEIACPVAEKPTKRCLPRATRSPIIQQASLIQEEIPVVEPVAPPQTNQVAAVIPKETVVPQEIKSPPRVILGSPAPADQPSSTKGRMSLRLFKSDPDQLEVPKTSTPVVTLASINN